jgi:formate dehydrogenase subunit gamma
MAVLSRLFAAFALVGLLGLAAPAAVAQQVNPTASSVQEEALMQALQEGQVLSGRVTIPDAKAAALIKPGNKGWAALHTGNMQLLATGIFLGTLGLLAAFYLFRGRIPIDGGRAGRSMRRFDGIERFGHWLVAVSFIVLSLTGLNLLVGTSVIQPLVGEAAFGAMTHWGKMAHNYVSWAFMLGLVLIFVTWVAENVPSKIDLVWLSHAGGLLSDHDHPPARKFNAGQKVIFWSTILGGAALSYTGVMMLFPTLAGSPADWQFYQLIHSIVSAVLAGVILAHIYIGSVGMEGAFDAMGTGEVDVNWARQHHSLWVEEVEDAAKTGARPGRAVPAE